MGGYLNMVSFAYLLMISDYLIFWVSFLVSRYLLKVFIGHQIILITFNIKNAVFTFWRVCEPCAFQPLCNLCLFNPPPQSPFKGGVLSSTSTRRTPHLEASLIRDLLIFLLILVYFLFKGRKMDIFSVKHFFFTPIEAI